MRKILMTLAAVLCCAMTMAVLTFSSCGQSLQSSEKESEADSLINTADQAQNYERVIALCDSFQQKGDISRITAGAMRGKANRMLGRTKLAEDELRKVLAETPTNNKERLLYHQCVCYLSDVIMLKVDYEGLLREILPKIEETKKWVQENPSSDSEYLLTRISANIAQAQLAMGMKKEADKMYESCYSYMQTTGKQDPAWIYDKALTLNNIVTMYVNAEDYPTAEKWLNRLDSMVTIVRNSADLSVVSHADEVTTIFLLSKAFVAQGMNRPQEAARAYDDYKKTQDAKTLVGRINSAEFLLRSKRYTESADAYAVLDDLNAEYNVGFSLDNTADYSRKFEANYKAGRRDSALAVAAYVFDNIDSAITKQKKSDAAELATIYETQQKDAEIAQQQISLSRQRWMGTLVALVLLTTFFIIYTWYRRRAEKRLGEAHVELQNAYNQLEETTAAKERIESELRIARDIQMSMVPGIFPEREGLDMYAEMTPAKEVGGDLYGYVLQGDVLYFCVGDVSGKGVPASLFMAQSARLFRTFAAEGMTPADIAVRMNNELAEGNDSNMFVTMFIGMLHLDTGCLDFCNCGHNAPVFDGQFLEMKYVNQMMGYLEGATFYGETIDDIRGHRLLVYTDGLNEAENQQKELLGNDRLLELMSGAATLDSHHVIDMLKEAVERHRAGAEPNDDLTLMCISLKNASRV